MLCGQRDGGLSATMDIFDSWTLLQRVGFIAFAIVALISDLMDHWMVHHHAIFWISVAAMLLAPLWVAYWGYVGKK